MSLFDKCHNFQRVEELKAQGVYAYFSPLASAQEPEIRLDGKRMLMLGSNSYLGLTTHPRIIEAAKNAVNEFGSSCAGSRFLNGTMEMHRELEQRLASFVGKEAAIVFTTGFQANLGTISTLVGKEDIVITDKTDHASIIDGARLSYGKMLRFNHNSIDDLERVLDNNGNGSNNHGARNHDIRNNNIRHGCPDVDAGTRIDANAGIDRGLKGAGGNGGNGSCNGRLVVVDGVFSMDGDLADLPGIVSVCEPRNVAVMVDDAHGLGVLGPRGDGTAAHFGLTDKVDLIMGTFSKSFASIGGFVAGDERVIDFIRHFARSMIFSASLPPAQVAAALASLDIIENEPERRQALWDNTHFLKDGLNALGFDTGLSETPIIPVVVGDDLTCFRMWRELHDEGMFVNPIVSPAVPADQALIRVSIMATHNKQQLEQALGMFEKVGKRMNLI